MGQKVHPESIRVGYIHDWKSNWFNEKHFADYLHEDTQIREHIVGRLSHAGLSDITIRKSAPWHRDRQVRLRGRPAAA
jgi:small subunit ribosomal protein S3